MSLVSEAGTHPRDLVRLFPADLKGMNIELMVGEKNSSGEDYVHCTFDETNAQNFPETWRYCYDNFGADQFGRIIIIVHADTALKDTSGEPYSRVSFLCVENGELMAFNKEEARDFLSAVNSQKTELPSDFPF